MRCEICGFLTPPPDSISIAIMQEHLRTEHGINKHRLWALPPLDEDVPVNAP